MTTMSHLGAGPSCRRGACLALVWAAGTVGADSGPVVLRSLIGTGTQSAEELKKETRLGVHVDDVDPAGAAHAAGLRGGDLILGVNGYRVAGASEVRYVINLEARSINVGLPEPVRVLAMPGQGRTVSMLVNRQGELQTLDVTVRGDGSLGYLSPDPAAGSTRC